MDNRGPLLGRQGQPDLPVRLALSHHQPHRDGFSLPEPGRALPQCSRRGLGYMITCCCNGLHDREPRAPTRRLLVPGDFADSGSAIQPPAGRRRLAAGRQG